MVEHDWRVWIQGEHLPGGRDGSHGMTGVCEMPGNSLIDVDCLSLSALLRKYEGNAFAQWDVIVKARKVGENDTKGDLVVILIDGIVDSRHQLRELAWLHSSSRRFRPGLVERPYAKVQVLPTLESQLSFA
jgi:hypothetical protein